MYAKFFIYLLNYYSKVNAGLSIVQPLSEPQTVSSAILFVISVLKIEVLAAETTKAAPNVTPLVRLSEVGGFQSQSLQVSSASKSVDAVDKYTHIHSFAGAESTVQLY